MKNAEEMTTAQKVNELIRYTRARILAEVGRLLDEMEGEIGFELASADPPVQMTEDEEIRKVLRDQNLENRFKDDHPIVSMYIRLVRDGLFSRLGKEPTEKEIYYTWTQSPDAFTDFRRLGARYAGKIPSINATNIAALSLFFHCKSKCGGYGTIDGFWKSVAYGGGDCNATRQLLDYFKEREKASTKKRNYGQETTEARKIIVKAYVIFATGKKSFLAIHDLDGVTLP